VYQRFKYFQLLLYVLAKYANFWYNYRVGQTFLSLSFYFGVFLCLSFGAYHCLTYPDPRRRTGQDPKAQGLDRMEIGYEEGYQRIIPTFY
jgi:hypothetical protein